MYHRQNGDKFDIERKNKIYHLRTYEADSCDGCMFYTPSNMGKCSRTKIEEAITGECRTPKASWYDQKAKTIYKEYQTNRIFVLDSITDTSKEITRENIEELTKSVKSIGEAFKIVEVFKQLAEKQNSIQ